jgi:polyhydroxyalkanoate synthesis regulator phasin
MSKRSVINLFDPINGSTSFVLSQGQAECTITTSTNLHITNPLLKLTSGSSVVNNVAGSIISNSTSITTENTRALLAESVLNQLILDEESSRTTADSTLQNNINVEKLRITTEITNRTTDVNAEETRSLAAELVLQNNITAEGATRLASDNLESANRISADTTIQTNLTNEISRASTAEALVQSNLNTQAARIDGILNLSTAQLDSFNEIVAAYGSADSNLLTLITTLTTDFTALKASFDQLTL